MKFKDLKKGFPLYILERETVEFRTEKVEDVSMPHIDAKMTATGMVVDVVTDKATYCMMAEADIAYPRQSVITTDKQNILREVETMKTTSEQALKQVEAHKEMVTRCNQLIGELDPTEKEKQATDARFRTLEAKMDRIMTLIEKGGAS